MCVQFLEPIELGVPEFNPKVSAIDLKLALCGMPFRVTVCFPLRIYSETTFLGVVFTSEMSTLLKVGTASTTRSEPIFHQVFVSYSDAMCCNVNSKFRRRLVSLLLDSGVMSVVLRVDPSFNLGSILIPSCIGAKFSGSTAYAKQALSIPFVLIHDSGETWT